MGADQARQYAGKYASKPEQHYYVETEKDSVKFFLKARTVGLCMAYNRLMGFRVVRSTRPVKFLHTEFLPSLTAGAPERQDQEKRLGRLCATRSARRRRLKPRFAGRSTRRRRRLTLNSNQSAMSIVWSSRRRSRFLHRP